MTVALDVLLLSDSDDVISSDSPDNHEAFSKQTDNILYDTDQALVIVITIRCCGQQQPVSVAI